MFVEPRVRRAEGVGTERLGDADPLVGSGCGDGLADAEQRADRHRVAPERERDARLQQGVEGVRRAGSVRTQAGLVEPPLAGPLEEVRLDGGDRTHLGEPLDQLVGQHLRVFDTVAGGRRIRRSGERVEGLPDRLVADGVGGELEARLLGALDPLP